MIVDDKLAKPDPNGNAGELEDLREMTEPEATVRGQTEPPKLLGKEG